MGLITDWVARNQLNADYQKLFNNMLVGSPQGSVNITPRVQPFDANSIAQLPPQAVAGAIGGVPPPPSQWQPPANIQPMGADNPALAQRAASYGGPAPPSLGPQAEQLRSMLDGVSASVGLPQLAAIMQKKANPQPASELGQLNQDVTSGFVKPEDYAAVVKKQTYLPGQTPESPVGKLAYDLKNGRITQKEYDAALAKETNLPGQGAVSPLGRLAEDFKAGRISQADYNAAVLRENRLPDDPLTQVFDPNSPTGTRNVSRKDALGQPGPMTANSPAPAISETSKLANAARVAAGEPLTSVFPGYRGNVMAQRDQARNGAIDKIIAENPGMSPSDAGTELANRTIAFQSGKKSSGQLTTMLGATKQAVGQLDFNIKKTKEEMAKLGSSDLSPFINAIARGEERWTGNPAYSSLFYYMHATAVESARILSGGQSSAAQLHQGAMEEANKWANINMTPASFDAVADAMTAEGANRVQNYNDALKSQRVGGAPPPGVGVIAPSGNSKIDDIMKKYPPRPK